MHRQALVLNVFEAIAFMFRRIKPHPLMKSDEPGVKAAVNRLTVVVCRASWVHRSRLLVERDVLDDHEGQLKLARAVLHGIVVSYFEIHGPQ